MKIRPAGIKKKKRKEKGETGPDSLSKGFFSRVAARHTHTHKTKRKDRMSSCPKRLPSATSESQYVHSSHPLNETTGGGRFSWLEGEKK